MVAKPAAAPVPAQPITITEVRPPGQIDIMEVGDYVPSAEDLARLAKNSTSAAPEPILSPPTPVPERATIIPPSIAKRTMEEMEAGRKISERKEEERRKRMAG